MIEVFNNHFQEICKNLTSSKKTFVLGLSGGMDSMALLYLLKNFIQNNKKFKIEIFPVIIDHNLRRVSSKEACEVKKIAIKLGFNTKIEKIYSKIPTGNIQNWARKKRRDLLFEIAHELSANLLLANHLDDQAETLFMRFTKNSGLEGLQGMRPISFWNGISIIRPLLFFTKKQLRSYVENNNINFFEDTSNSMLKFERVKTRYLLNIIKKNKWPNISQDLNKFSDINNHLIKKIKFLSINWVEQNILIDNSGAAIVNFNKLKIIFQKSNLFSINIFGKIIQTVGGKEFPPKRKKTYNLIQSIFFNNFNNKTLGNVNIFRKNNEIYFLREQRNINLNVEIKKDKLYIFDGRFLIISKKSGYLISSSGNDLKIISDVNPFFKYKEIINNTIPHLQTLEGTRIKPHLNQMNMNSVLNIKSNNKPFGLYLMNRVLV